MANLWNPVTNELSVDRRAPDGTRERAMMAEIEALRRELRRLKRVVEEQREELEAYMSTVSALHRRMRGSIS